MKEHPIAAGVFLLVVVGGIALGARAGLTAAANYERNEVLRKLNKALKEARSLAEEQNDYEAAIHKLEQTIEQHPNEAGLYLNLGIAQSLAKKLEDADKSFAKALELDPEDYDALAERASVQKEKGNLSAALEILEKIPPGRGQLAARLREDPLWLDVDEPRMKALKEKHGIIETDTSLETERPKEKGAPQDVRVP